MCNLYRMTKGVDEIARLVVAEGKAQAMNWSFPHVGMCTGGGEFRRKVGRGG